MAFCRRRLVGRRDVHAAVVLDVDLDAGLLDDAADRLAARADDVADLLGRDADRDDARRVGGDVRRAAPRAPPPSCRGSRSRPLRACSSALRMMSIVMPPTLMSICSAVMPVARAGDLEVHVAVVVLGARDVGEHRPLAGLLVHHEAHRHAGDRRLERHAGVHQRQRAAADRRHRRRAVRFEDVGDDADACTGIPLRTGSSGTSARSASAPWPTSRRPGPRRNCTSPTENGGKL